MPATSSNGMRTLTTASCAVRPALKDSKIMTPDRKIERKATRVAKRLGSAEMPFQNNAQF